MQKHYLIFSEIKDVVIISKNVKEVLAVSVKGLIPKTVTLLKIKKVLHYLLYVTTQQFMFVS
jgi:hypothetical protein